MSEQARVPVDPEAGVLSVGEANGCFVCGPANPAGLGVTFRLEGDWCLGEFTPQAQHTGFDNVTHGGILFALLDDVMANWLWLQGLPCFTGRAEIRYRENLPIGVPVQARAECLKRKSRLAQMRGEILRLDTAAIVAETTAGFMLQPRE